jgi:chromosome segregation protein
VASSTAACRSGTLKQHQLWFLKHRDAASEEERVKQAMLEATNALEARMAELRHVEAELETIRQAHYAAGDELHGAQGAGRGRAEVSRLEAHPLRGRRPPARAAAPGRAEGADEQWASAASRPRPSSAIAEQIAAAEAGRDAGRPGRRAGRLLPELEDACAPPRPRNEQRAWWPRCSSRSRCWPPRAAASTSSAPAARRERLAAERSWPRPTAALSELQAQRRRRRGAGLAEARLHELGEQVPALDEERRASSRSTPRAASRPT